MKFKLIITILISIVLINYHYDYVDPTLFVKTSFESEDFLTEGGFSSFEKCCGYSFTRSDSVARDGQYSARVELWKNDDAGGYRSEIVAKGETTQYLMQERWYRFSMFLPSNAFFADSGYIILWQLHEYPDFDLGEEYRSPPISLRINKKQWQIQVRRNASPVNNGGVGDSVANYFLGDFQRDAWIDWTFRIKMSYLGDGILQVWRNDTLVVDRLGSNYYNDLRGPYSKWGLYKPDFNSVLVNSTKFVYFLDKISVSTHSGDPFYKGRKGMKYK